MIEPEILLVSTIILLGILALLVVTWIDKKGWIPVSKDIK